jgi:hypothetical protein
MSSVAAPGRPDRLCIGNYPVPNASAWAPLSAWPGAQCAARRAHVQLTAPTETGHQRVQPGWRRDGLEDAAPAAGAESVVATLAHPSVQALLTPVALGPGARVAAHTQAEGAAGTPALRLRATAGSLVWTVGHDAANGAPRVPLPGQTVVSERLARRGHPRAAALAASLGRLPIGPLRLQALVFIVVCSVQGAPSKTQNSPAIRR